MNGRLVMPSAMPADRAEVLSDCADDLTPAQEDEIEAHAEAALAERIGDPEWMVSLLDDTLHTGRDLHAALKALDKAINGDEIARNAVFAALSNIQKQAALQAREYWLSDLKDEAETELFGGA
ncbi:MAG: hypothetical protein WC100_05695 [Sterolibacterium sp.]